MAHCGNCGRDDAARVVTTFLNGAEAEKCNLCAKPGDSDFTGKVMDPSDKKMWPDWIVNPKGYKQRGDTLVATDETLADLEAEVSSTKEADAELAEAVRKKREFVAHRNQIPLTQAEIDARVEEFRRQREEVEKLARFQESGLVLP
jgi:hypothetical protein